MTLCRFFQQGNCRYGNSCRFEHTNPYKYHNHGNQALPNNANTMREVTPEQLFEQVFIDTNSAINGKQWVLTCYSPFKMKPNFPGFDDISPEEVASQYYEAKMNGTTMQFENQLKQMYAQVMDKFRMLLKPNKVISDAIQRIYKGEIPENPFLAQIGGFNQNQSVFGNSMPAQSGGNLFGAAQNNPPNPGGNIFGNAAKMMFPATNNVFGGQTNLFGQSNVFQPQMESNMHNENMFDKQMNAFAQPTSIFAQPANQPAQNPQSIFSTNSFNQNQPNVFGNAAQPNVFGQNQSNVTPVNLFAAANANLETNLPSNVFNQQPTVQPTVQPNQSIFNTQTSDADPFRKPNVFEVAASANIFGIAVAPIAENIYSKLENLTEDELNAFKSDHFEDGLIPEVPPPLELCN